MSTEQRCFNSVDNLIKQYTELPVFFIAEAGSSHLGSWDKAASLVRQTAAAGINAVKFQYIIADEILHPDSGLISINNRQQNLYKRFKTYEKPQSFYKKLARLCSDKNILFFCSAFGRESARALSAIKVPAAKIASPELNYNRLLDYWKRQKQLLFISTGMAYLSDVKAAVKRLGSSITPSQLALLQCVSAYPARPEDYNLLTLYTFKNKFQSACGISDHTPDQTVAKLGTVMAALAGFPFIIEKHVKLYADTRNLDNDVALSVPRISRLHRELVQLYNKVQHSVNNGNAGIDWLEIFFNTEQSYYNRKDIKKLSRLCGTFLPEINPVKIEKILGNGRKKPAAVENEYRLTSRRSLLAVKDIKAGEPVNEHNSAWLRAEKNLQPGMTYEDFPEKQRLTAGRHILSSMPLTLNNCNVK
ncbi:MAG TPA: N-acetylneuraminate synthase family protein [Spirochaetota bacterium]|nr:N-acetylneuraminate synthase family protein [Spirochaetota bacterium]